MPTLHNLSRAARSHPRLRPGEGEIGAGRQGALRAAGKRPRQPAAGATADRGRVGPSANFNLDRYDFFRQCEKRSDEAIQGGVRDPGLLRFARNDGKIELHPNSSRPRVAALERCDEAREEFPESGCFLGGEGAEYPLLDRLDPLTRGVKRFSSDLAHVQLEHVGVSGVR